MYICTKFLCFSYVNIIYVNIWKELDTKIHKHDAYNYILYMHVQVISTMYLLMLDFHCFCSHNTHIHIIYALHMFQI